MIDRGKIAVLLLVLGAGLAVVGSFEDTYRTIFRGYGGSDQVLTTTLWIVSSEPPDGPARDAYHAIGWPVVGAAVLMVVAAVFTLRQRTAQAAKAAAMGAAGALGGVVLAYWLQVRQEQAVISSWASDGSSSLEVLGGMYLLVGGAIAGLAGAVLAQRRSEPLPEEPDEDAVVVHQLGSDEDTPPFGLAIPDENQEPR